MFSTMRIIEIIIIFLKFIQMRISQMINYNTLILFSYNDHHKVNYCNVEYKKIFKNTDDKIIILPY